MPKDRAEDLDDYRRRAVMAKKGMQEKATFTLPEGKTIFRILKTPSDVERNSPRIWIEYYMHFNIGPKKFKQRCGEDADGSGECWLCRRVERERAKGRIKVAEEMERRKTFEVQAAIWDEDLGGLRGPVRWPVSGKSTKSLAYKIASICASEKADKYLNHKTGYNFAIERTGTGMTDTNYLAPEREEEQSAVPVEIIRKLKPFVDVIPQYDEEQQKRAYFGQKEDEDDEGSMGTRKPRRREEEDEEEDDRPRRKPRVEDDEEDSIEAEPEQDDDDEDEDDVPVKQKPKQPKRRPEVEDEEDVEEDVEYGEDEDEDEKPKKPVKKPARKVVEEEDEDEEGPSLEEDEDEKPVKKPARKVVEEEEEDEEPVKPKRKPRAEPEPEDEDEEEEDRPKPRKPKR